MGHHGFHRRRRGIALELNEHERELLADMLEQLVEMVAPDPGSIPEDPLAAMIGISPDATLPSDPALARLLPDAYEDPAMAGEFRRFTDGDLRRAKVARASRARASLARAGRIDLDDEDVMAWLGALNDLRLVLGTRLEVTEDERVDPATLPGPAAQMYLVYDWLTYLQDQLLGVLPDPPTRDAG